MKHGYKLRRHHRIPDKGYYVRVSDGLCGHPYRIADLQFSYWQLPGHDDVVGHSIWLSEGESMRTTLGKIVFRKEMQ